MFSWFRRKRDPDGPFVRTRSIGVLNVFSGTVLLGDPMYLPDVLRLENVPQGNVSVVAKVIHYPEGRRRIASVELTFADHDGGKPDQLGKIGVDSGSVAVLDAQTFEQFWKDEGPARIGVLSSPQHRKVAKLLQRRFGLRSEPVNVVRSELVKPVSKELEEEIIAYLKTIPEYAEFPVIVFRIETRNTYEQLQDNLHTQGLACEVVLDTPSGAKVLAFESGLGDGCYPAYGFHVGDRLVKVAVPFIGPDQEKMVEDFPPLRY